MTRSRTLREAWRVLTAPVARVLESYLVIPNSVQMWCRAAKTTARFRSDTAAAHSVLRACAA